MHDISSKRGSMRRIIDTKAPPNNNHGNAFYTRKDGGRRNSRFTRRLFPNALQLQLQNLLFAGIVVLTAGSILLYCRLAEIESRSSSTGIYPILRNSIKRNQRGQIPPALLDPRFRIPGRASGSERGRVKCDQDISHLVSYWNDPRSDVDLTFESPFLEPPSDYKRDTERRRYLSFEPDLGGWNNIRMEFEIMVVLAAATGRTLILPPDNPLYLLNKEKANRHRGLQTFLKKFDDIVETIPMKDFFEKESKFYPLPTDEKNRTRIVSSFENCYWMAKSDNSCLFLFQYLVQVADYVPDWHGEHHCLIMDDENWFRDQNERQIASPKQIQIKKFCDSRKPVFYDKQVHDAPLLHIHSHHKDTRLLLHFYAFIYFTNPKVGNYFKRLVRDRVRYSDEIFCAGGKIVKHLMEESLRRPDKGAGPGYFSMHIRRGDFQWRKMRISAKEWFENTRSWLVPDKSALLYIATDETNKTFFEPLMEHYEVRFLDNYTEIAGLSDLDPNYVGMIDQVAASMARVFVGTYFSSFSAFIGRMRGYHLISGKDMYYSHPDYWNETHNWAYPHASYSAREYPLGWAGIDEDDEPSEEDFY
mmetsp:Transcript_34475/g.72665  ORF Transcript_34475/g.72665 Transcript_34475/m.72665 type:complete len:587 (-) Transcript_34475:3476-5236(-)